MGQDVVEQRSVVIHPIVDLLGRRRPEILKEIQAKYPSYAEMLRPGKMLGTSNHSQASLLIELAFSTIGIAKQECNDTYQLVARRLRSSARLRFGGAIVSSASSGGLVAALIQEATQIAIIVGALAFLSSGFTLVAQYIEEYAGGQNSLREMRDRLVRHVAESGEIEAELRLMEIRGAFEDIESLIRKLNALIASVRQIQMAVN